MRIGILADIHERVELLLNALEVFDTLALDRIVLLGDLFEAGDRLDSLVAVLEGREMVGVWGNHDFGFCDIEDPPSGLEDRYRPETLAFMQRLTARHQEGDCLFTHVEPWLDPTRLEDLWWFEGLPETPERLGQSFTATTQRVLMMGHFHRWRLGTPEGLLPWRGEGPVRLDGPGRYLVTVGAVCEGWAAVYDTQSAWLVPVSLIPGR